MREEEKIEREESTVKQLNVFYMEDNVTQEATHFKQMFPDIGDLP